MSENEKTNNVCRRDLTNAVMRITGFRRVDIEKVINAYTEVIYANLKAGRSVKLHRLCTFKVVDLAPREFRSNLTGEIVHKPARKRVRVKLSSRLQINEKN